MFLQNRHRKSTWKSWRYISLHSLGCTLVTTPLVTTPLVTTPLATAHAHTHPRLSTRVCLLHAHHVTRLFNRAHPLLFDHVPCTVTTQPLCVSMQPSIFLMPWLVYAWCPSFPLHNAHAHAHAHGVYQTDNIAAHKILREVTAHGPGLPLVSTRACLEFSEDVAMTWWWRGGGVVVTWWRGVGIASQGMAQYSTLASCGVHHVHAANQCTRVLPGWCRLWLKARRHWSRSGEPFTRYQIILII